MKKWLIEQLISAFIVLSILSVFGLFNNIFQMYLYEH